jgi:orotate phosphoribosyltransferase
MNNKKPIYDIAKSYTYNLINGPFFDDKIPPIPETAKENWVDFLGFKVRSKLGVPAGPLLNSKWTTLSSNLGFDIITYKTIRSNCTFGHKYPNVILLSTDNQLTKYDLNSEFKQKIDQTTDAEKIAITNSFGMPSMDEDFLLEDIKKAIEELKEGQILVVSVVGSEREGVNLVEDFAETAKIAKRAGAKIIELNFSCPNVKGKEGVLYKDVERVEEIIKKVKDVVQEIPIIIKLGIFEDLDSFKNVLSAIEKGGAVAIAGINSVSLCVKNEDGSPALGVGREKSGVCGGPIKQMALEWVKDAKKIIGEQNLNLKIIGMGGVVKHKHFDEFLNAGADFVMSATGMMWNPFLALNYKKEAQKKDLILNLFEIGAIKFGQFTLKSGILSPIYMDLRVTVSYPKILTQIADMMYGLIKDKDFDLVCGVPYTALPFATALSIKNNIPMVMRRKEKKDYGTKKMIEGIFAPGQRCLIIEDLITSGSSVLETAEDLKNENLLVNDAVILLDRQQSGAENLLKQNIKVKSVFNMEEILNVLLNANKITKEKYIEVTEYLRK